MKIKFYQEGRRRPVTDFLDKLSSEDRAKIVSCLSSIEKLGFDSPRVVFRQIKGSLWEIKIRAGRSGYRVFYVCVKRENMVLLHAYKKQSQKAPKKEIEIAEKRMIKVIQDDNSYIN